MKAQLTSQRPIALRRRFFIGSDCIEAEAWVPGTSAPRFARAPARGRGVRVTADERRQSLPRQPFPQRLAQAANTAVILNSPSPLQPSSCPSRRLRKFSTPKPSPASSSSSGRSTSGAKCEGSGDLCLDLSTGSTIAGNPKTNITDEPGWWLGHLLHTTGAAIRARRHRRTRCDPSHRNPRYP